MRGRVRSEQRRVRAGRGDPASARQDAAVSRLVELLRADGLVVNGFLYRVDDQRYVRDGHHQVPVALGESTIDAEVIQLGSRS